VWPSQPCVQGARPAHQNGKNLEQTNRRIYHRIAQLGRLPKILIRMFYFVGLGLSDEKDITVKGLEIVKRAERVYLEAYTAILMVGKEHLVRS
jgi:hypothetical protein